MVGTVESVGGKVRGVEGVGGGVGGEAEEKGTEEEKGEGYRPEHWRGNVADIWMQ
jgi:hypothetical protein